MYFKNQLTDRIIDVTKIASTQNELLISFARKIPSV